MARLHEYQGKELLKSRGMAVPDGRVARSTDEAADIAADLGGSVVLKAQAWMTGRADKGGVLFAESPDEAHEKAEKLLQLTFGNFPVTELLVEQAIDIEHELFISLTIDDAAQAPLLLLDLHGGTGIEERAEAVGKIPVDVRHGVSQAHLRETLTNSNIDKLHHSVLIDAIIKIVTLATEVEARSFEVNPLAITHDGQVMAADCRVTIDDYAVFRHPELGIEIARELDHPPTELERIAYCIEQDDHRGTFYFAQLPTDEAGESKGLIGFHGAGGGGSMMSMDAVSNAGFTLANFCDTSGNPSAAKVYRAARTILAQPGIIGYFGSGSGVASQEQFWSAYGLAKAFIEMNMAIPAVIRLGGNSEDRAVDILESIGKQLPATIEGYKKDDAPQKCAERFAQLVEEAGAKPVAMARHVPGFVGSEGAYSFPIEGGRVWIDHDNCDEETTALVIDHGFELFKEESGKPVLAVSEEEVAKKDSELIACEIECYRARKSVVFVDLAIEGLDTDAKAHGLLFVGSSAGTDN